MGRLWSVLKSHTRMTRMRTDFTRIKLKLILALSNYPCLSVDIRVIRVWRFTRVPAQGIVRERRYHLRGRRRSGEREWGTGVARLGN